MRRILLVLLILALGLAGGVALAVAADVRTFPGVDARRTAAEPQVTATVTATATATTTATATVTATPTQTASSTPTTSASPSATAAPTLTATATPVPTGGPVRLEVTKEGSHVLRTGPVTCYLLSYFGDRWAECTVTDQAFAEPKRPASCEYDWASQFTLKARATYGTCRSDANDRDSVTRLAPGERAVDGPITCVATADGIGCTNEQTRHGFTVSRASYRLF